MPVKVTLEISKGDAMKGNPALAALLRGAARNKGYSNRRLADLAKINEVDASRYLSGRRNPSMARLKRLADVLGLEFQDLLEVYLQGTTERSEGAR